MQNSKNSKGNAMELIQQLEGKVRDKNAIIQDLEKSIVDLRWLWVSDSVKSWRFWLGVICLALVQIIGLGIYYVSKDF